MEDYVETRRQLFYENVISSIVILNILFGVQTINRAAECIVG